MTKEKLEEKIYKIQNMQSDELAEFAQKVSLADLDRKSQTFLFRAIEIRQIELEEQSSPFVVASEFKVGEI